MVGKALKGHKTRNLVVGLLLAVTVAGGLVANHQVTGGASVLGNRQDLARLQLVNTSLATVPYLGPFAADKKHGKVCGPEVKAMEGALIHAKFRKGTAANCVGIPTKKQLIAFQRAKKIPVSGIYGLRTHKALSPYYTKQQRADLQYTIKIRQLELKRNLILGITAHAQAYQGRMQYCNNGSLSSCGLRWNWPAYPDVPHNTDCSGFVTWVYFQSGLPDPNGNSYRGGFTGTLVVHGVPVAPGGPLHIGDLVFNGPSASNTTHVSIYIGHGLTMGHGKFGIQIHAYAYRTIVAIRRYF